MLFLWKVSQVSCQAQRNFSVKFIRNFSYPEKFIDRYIKSFLNKLHVPKRSRNLQQPGKNLS